MPRIGVSALVATGQSYGIATLGGNLGVGLMVRMSDHFGIRADYTSRAPALPSQDGTPSFQSATMGLAWMR